MALLGPFDSIKKIPRLTRCYKRISFNSVRISSVKVVLSVWVLGGGRGGVFVALGRSSSLFPHRTV